MIYLWIGLGSGLITIETVTVLQYGHRAAGAPVQ
jgi:hypothetical protein